MSQRDVWGFKWDGISARTMEGPGAGRYMFQLIDARKDTNKKKKPYVNAGCKVLSVIRGDKNAKDLIHWEYLSLEMDRLGFTKSFFEKIGAGHCLREDRSPKDAEGTLFEADIIVSKNEKGEYYNLRRIVAVDADGHSSQSVNTAGEDEVEDEGEVEEGTEGTEEAGEGEVTAADIAAMSASELTELARLNDVQIPANIKALRAKRAFMAEELIGEPLPTTGPRAAAVGASR